RRASDTGDAGDQTFRVVDRRHAFSIADHLRFRGAGGDRMTRSESDKPALRADVFDLSELVEQRPFGSVEAREVSLVVEDEHLVAAADVAAREVADHAVEAARCVRLCFDARHRAGLDQMPAPDLTAAAAEVILAGFVDEGCTDRKASWP